MTDLSLNPPQSILVFRIGQLGDTIVALPAMWAVRKQFPDAKLTLLSDRHPDKRYVLGADLLRGAGLFDAFESYVVDKSARGKITKPFQMLKLLWRLRRGNFDTLVYLAPSTRTSAQVERDRSFFTKVGIRHFVGTRGFAELPQKIPGQPLGATPSESDLILLRVAADGIAVPEVRKKYFDLGLGDADESEIAEWLKKLSPDGGRKWIGIGPGSKMAAKRWPEERFRDVVATLIERFDVWPVTFGGAEDAVLGNRLHSAWKRGYNAAGKLSLRGSALALRHCVFLLTNDTGTMHLGAAASVPCVALFSAREWPGMWFPSGEKHWIFRSKIECEGCSLVECIERKNECLQRITTAQVLSACQTMLAENPLEIPFCADTSRPT